MTWAILVVAWWLLGPWVLAAAVLLLLLLALLARRLPRVPTPGHLLRPTRPGRVAAIGVTAVLMATTLVLLAPEGRFGLPQGAGALVVPSYTGRPAEARPIEGVEPGQNEHVARNGAVSARNDPWGTGAYPWPGPLGVDPHVSTAWYGARACSALVVDSASRLVGLCRGWRPGGASRLLVIDPESMHPVDSLDLPAGDGEGVCTGSSLFLDAGDQVVVPTADGRIVTVGTRGDAGSPELAVVRAVEIDEVGDDDCLVGLVADWQGRVWFTSRRGVVGVLGADGTGVRVVDLQAGIAHAPVTDEDGGVFVVTDQALYRLDTPSSGTPVVTWRAPYDRGTTRKSGQRGQGSGTGPTLLGGGLVALTDNADPRMRVVFVDRESGETRCRARVFEPGASAADSGLVAVGPRSVVVQNSAGYDGPWSTLLGFASEPGMARVDAGRCRVAWTAAVAAPATGAKVSLETGLVYTHAKRPTWTGVSAWYLTAVDARTGRIAWSVRTGTGALMNSHRAVVTLTPGGSAFVGTVAGLVRVRDSYG